MQKYISKSPRETLSLAEDFSAEILHTKPGRQALVVGLVGELGSGKTQLVKGVARGLGIKKRITSPTFLLRREFNLPALASPKRLSAPRRQVKRNFNRLYHFDLYRLHKTGELKQLGFKELVAEPANIVVVEWAERARAIMPKGTIWIEFRHGRNERERHLTFNRR